MNNNLSKYDLGHVAPGDGLSQKEAERATRIVQLANMSKEEVEMMKDNMEKKLDEFKSVFSVLNSSYGNMIKEMESGNVDRDIVEKIADDTEVLGAGLMNSIDKYLEELPEIKHPALLGIRDEIKNLFSLAGSVVEESRQRSFSVLGKKKAASV